MQTICSGTTKLENITRIPNKDSETMDTRHQDTEKIPKASADKANAGERPKLHKMNGRKRRDSCQNKYSNKQKVTDLYIIIGDEVSETSQLKSFLLHRMGNRKALDFEMVNYVNVKNRDRGNNMITIRFQSFSKAAAARNLLHKSNRNVSSKVQCYFERAHADGEVVHTIKHREGKLEKAFREIVENAESVVSKHDAKLQDIGRNLSDIDNELGKKRGLSFSQYDKLSNEKLAFTDKFEELERQRKEFTRYIQSMKRKLAQLINSDKFDNELKEIRIAFGVECRRLTAALPMYARREDILSIIENNQVCVILGETGSGKSTQMVQYLYQAGFAADGQIACTQPRKIAAVSLATHVALEVASSVGQVIGYKVGMQTKTTAVTKVVFMTDHILLTECLKDRMLTKYSCILIDEAHERSIHTDLLLGMLKEALGKRPELKLIITSATIDPDIFVDYFGGMERCPVLTVSGRTFPVDVFWEYDDTFESAFPEGYEAKALSKAIEIHKSTNIEDGDILVFLTSAVEIEKCSEKMKNQVGEQEVQCLQLHGKLKPEEQQLVFEKTPRGKRKVVFATNSAETSITIPGIKFVVDTGVVKEMRFDPKKNMNSLDVVSVSQSSANQRKGRAGRTASGVCYRLYSESNYKRMEKTSSPEILRIQVSQALLKLMELGVDPMQFDYVQSPSVEAMESALSELKDIGAVDATGLSELGKWIAKLPVEPRLGVLIKKGIDIHIPTEALVVASCCNQSGIFFRVGTQEEKKSADMNKLKFCHQGGDLLTMLNVYREWDKVPEKEKGKWCQSNSINGKAMKGVRDMMNEIMSTLKIDQTLKIKHAFRTAEDADHHVQHLVFECMTANLGYYLGHESAGYIIVNRLQRVKIHPSSAILSIGKQPEWVVFNRVLKTSDDFITEVTPVANTVVEDAINQHRLNVDVIALERHKVKRVLKIPTGKHVYWKFVGPMHSNRRKVEEDIARACNDSLVIVEANKQWGEISLFCSPEYENQASARLRLLLETLSQQLLNESREEPIGNDCSGVRALLRDGGATVDILMPNEYRALNIKLKESSKYDLDEDMARKIFELYGPVEQISRPTGKKQCQSPFWGRVTFTNEIDAVGAAQSINDDEERNISVVPMTFANQRSSSQQGFTMKLTWCRRPAKGHCFVYLNRPEDISSLSMSALLIHGTNVIALHSKEQSDLYIKDLPLDVTDDHIKEGLARKLGLTLSNCRDRFRVIIPRENVIWSADQWLRRQEQLAEIISRYTTRDSFRVNVREYKQQTVMGMAFVTFSDSQVCYDTGHRMMGNNIALDRNVLKFSFECKSNVHVNQRLYDIVKDDIEGLIDKYKQNNSTTVLEARQLKSGHVSLDITAVTPQKLAKAKVIVDLVVGGDTLECGDKDNLHVLFSKDGRQHAQQVEQVTKTIIFVDERQMKVTIKGIVQDRIHAIEMVEDYIAKHTGSVDRQVRLKGEDNPPGLMKALLVQYGIRFEQLKKDTGVFGVILNLRVHEITISGKEEAITKAIEKIKELRDDIAKRDKVKIVEAEFPDCPICLCPVEESDMCRLEYCGHAYCNVCLTSQIQTAISDRQLPVVCAAEDCNKTLVIRDINSQIRTGNIEVKALLNAAVTCFVTKTNDAFRYCITPNCEVVYRVTSNGTRFICPMCHAKICTSCHLDFHDGMTCAMYKSARDGDDSVEKWVRDNPQNRKMCPKCQLGIEKIDGCNHMACTCGAHICWTCLKYFSSSGECYEHMRQGHGTFM